MKCFTEAELAAYVAAQRPPPTRTEVHTALLQHGVQTHGMYGDGVTFELGETKRIVAALLSLWEQRG